MAELIQRLATAPRVLVSITPTQSLERDLTIERCQEILTAAQVHSRGWLFPYFDHGNVRAGPNNSYLSGEAAFEGMMIHVEEWRLFASGQFVDRVMLWDAMDEQYQQRARDLAEKYGRRAPLDVKGFVSFMLLVGLISDIYAFMARFVQAVPFDLSADIRIGVLGVKGWALSGNDLATRLHDVYSAREDQLWHRESMPLEIMIASPHAAARGAIRSIFAQFAWLAVSDEAVAQYQRGVFR